jgi:hypothetical protein
VSGVMVAEVWKRCIPQAKVLFMVALAEESNDLGHVFINPNYISWKLSLNIRSVQRLIVECTEQGYLVKVDASHHSHEGPYNLQLEQVKLKPAYGQAKEPEPIPQTTKAPTYPDWWAPLTSLKGYKEVKNNASRVAVVTAACASYNVEPAQVIDSFVAYWPIGQLKHRWSDPVAALNRTIEIQIKKVNSNAELGRHTEERSTEERTDNWAERANDKYSPSTAGV